MAQDPPKDFLKRSAQSPPTHDNNPEPLDSARTHLRQDRMNHKKLGHLPAPPMDFIKDRMVSIRWYSGSLKG